MFSRSFAIARRESPIEDRELLAGVQTSWVRVVGSGATSLPTVYYVCFATVRAIVWEAMGRSLATYLFCATFSTLNFLNILLHGKQLQGSSACHA